MLERITDLPDNVHGRALGEGYIPPAVAGGCSIDSNLLYRSQPLYTFLSLHPPHFLAGVTPDLHLLALRLPHDLAPPADIASRIEAGAQQAEKAALNRSLEANNRHFAVAREKLEQWAEDKD